MPRPLDDHELGEEQPKATSGKDDLIIGQADSMLIVSSSMRLVEKVVIRLTGGGVPCLGDQAAYNSDHQTLLRDSPFYGWVNTKAFMDLLEKQIAQRKENPEAPNPFQVVKPEKVLSATGLDGLKTAAFALHKSREGDTFEVFLGVPESSRRGIFKILEGESKEANVPPFVPADVMTFSRWRIDGQKAWATLVKMLTDLSPEALKGINFILDTANMAAQQKDPGFDVRKNLIGNLGDDMINYEKPPRSLSESASAPSLFLLGSPAPAQLAVALKSIFVFITVQTGPPADASSWAKDLLSALAVYAVWHGRRGRGIEAAHFELCRQRRLRSLLDQSVHPRRISSQQ